MTLRLLPILLLLAGGILLARSVRAQADTALPLPAADPIDAAQRLELLYDEIWVWLLDEHPEMGTYFGIDSLNNRWTDYSRIRIEARKEAERRYLGELDSIDRADLEPDRQLDYDLLATYLRTSVAGHRFPDELMVMNQMYAVHHNMVDILQMMPARRVRDFEDRIARLEAAPQMVRQTIDLLREGLRRGVTPPQITLRDLPEQILNVLHDEVEESPLYSPFLNLPESIEESRARELQARAREVIAGDVNSSLDSLHKFIIEEYIPNSRLTFGLSSVPDGNAWYEHAARASTTTNLAPEHIHEIGLQEVSRIRTEMEAIKAESGFEGDLEAFFHFLRTDPQFFAESPEALIRDYRDISKRADAELVKLFGTLPRLPYGVQAVPSYAEKSQTTAYYQPGSLRAGRPGMFFANTYDLRSRPRWEMEALTLHEAVPGHHLQIALADELEGIHDLRKAIDYTAFVEGWGLYAESLGSEMGFYTDPYSRFGQLTYEMWRAVRLVVDTGLHALGWTRDQAITYFMENAPKSEHDITVEVDRYLVWPGQALAYKIGELKIKELRARAETRLGENFDIRAFHDEVLGNGAVPLDVLENRINDWIETRGAER